jgi:Ca2+-binding EF-hand superfamily protein
MASPSKLKQSYTVSEEEEDDDIVGTPTKSSTNHHSSFMRAHTEPPPSPSARRLPEPPKASATGSRDTYSRPSSRSIDSGRPAQRTNLGTSSLSQVDPMSKLPPALLHNLRESFSVLDSNSSGHITPSSISETLTSLGIQESNLAQFFPSGQAQQVSLPQYINQLASLLAALSPQQELLNAFSAFDDDDSGQIDVAELKNALLTTLPDAGEQRLAERDVDRALEGYTGRRILGRNTGGISGVRGVNTPAPKRNGGDVFRYQEFVANLTGGPPVMAAGPGPEHVQAGGPGLAR